MSVRVQQLRSPVVPEPATESALDAALARLTQAFDGLEAVVHRRTQSKASTRALEEQLQVLFEDRARLAHELDRVKARAARLDAVSAEVAGRLETVITDIGTVLGGR